MVAFDLQYYLMINNVDLTGITVEELAANNDTQQFKINTVGETELAALTKTYQLVKQLERTEEYPITINSEVVNSKIIQQGAYLDGAISVIAEIKPYTLPVVNEFPDG